MESQIRVAVVYGAPQAQDIHDTVAGWVAERIWQDGRFAVDPVEPEWLGAAEARRRLAAAAAAVLVTPESLRGRPPPLAGFLQEAPALWTRPLAFVSHGGARAVGQLRRRLAGFAAPTDCGPLRFVHARQQFDARGRLHRPGPAEQAMAGLLACLHAGARHCAAQERTA